MANKHSLTMFDGHEDLQANITNDAFAFAQIMMAEAKKNSLAREQFIKEATFEPSQGKYMGQRLSVTRRSR